MKDKGTAAILAFFLGPFGIHRFYLGQAGLGVVYLLFCWTPVIWIISVIDFLAFLLGSTHSFDLKYNRSMTNHHQPMVQVTQNAYHAPAPHAQAAPTPQSAARREDQLERLEKLHSLKERGILSEDEFMLEKSKILGHQSTTPAKQENEWNDPFLG
jgi:TM2 domain-containing membrane protein YozV